MPRQSLTPSDVKVKKKKWDFSPRQLLAMYWWVDERTKWLDGVIADGSIRSGKTTAFCFGFATFVMENFSDDLFAICGKTKSSVERNVLIPLRDLCPCLGYRYVFNKQEWKVTLIAPDGHKNSIYIFGGNDERSQSLIQGITLAGVYFDEVALLPESFVNQAIARCSVPGAKFWMNCNPEGSTHYIKTSFIDEYQGRHVLHIPFTMWDNNSLTEERRQFYARQYTGIFYKRFILGEWCLADGLVYQCYDDSAMTFDGGINFDDYSFLKVGFDYGTQNPAAYILVGYNERTKRLEAVKEYYYSGRDTMVQKTDNELYDDLVEFMRGVPATDIYGDPSAESFHTVIRKKKDFRSHDADNSVTPGISFVSQLFSLGQLYVHKSCTNLRKELMTYAWDSEKSEKEGKDIVLKQNDHLCDALRYVVYTFFEPKAKMLKLGFYSE